MLEAWGNLGLARSQGALRVPVIVFRVGVKTIKVLASLSKKFLEDLPREGLYRNQG